MKMDDHCNVVVPECEVQLPEEQMTVLRNRVPDPFQDDGNSGTVEPRFNV